eukprot:m.117954 g.117954  ORF g.117954 m.117954 type:complete len:465 (+) comp17191_c0_seq14:210-1604(+)
MHSHQRRTGSWGTLGVPCDRSSRVCAHAIDSVMRAVVLILGVAVHIASAGKEAGCPFCTRPRPQPETDSPSCALNTTRPCPLPKWKIQWNLAASTAIGLYNATGYFNASDAARWGLVSFDWNNARSLWTHRLEKQGCEESMVEQCRQVKEVNPFTKCFVYRNTELALEWMTSQHEVMDASHAGYFLQFQATSNGSVAEKCAAAGPCVKNTSSVSGDYCCAFGSVYAEGNTYVEKSMLSTWRQFFWDFRNESLQSWWVNNFILGINGVGSSGKWVDGVFSDDCGGLPQEHETAISRMGYSSSEIADIHFNTASTWQLAMNKLVENHGYAWQMFGNHWLTALPPTRSNCLARMRQLCQPARQRWPMMMYGPGGPTWGWNHTEGNTTLSSFLITRPPYGWIGYSIEDSRACHDGNTESCWNPLFDMDVGEPVGFCVERAGVFSRAWSKGTAVLDCNTFAAVLPFALT